MTGQANIFVSRELEGLLSANSVSIADILQSEGIDYEVDFDSGSVMSEDGNTRDITLALLIGMGIIATATPLIRGVIERLTHKPVIVRELRLVPVESSSGTVIRAADGNPVLYWIELNRLLDPGNGGLSQSERLKLSAEAPMGIRFEIDSTRNQEDAHEQ